MLPLAAGGMSVYRARRASASRGLRCLASSLHPSDHQSQGRGAATFRRRRDGANRELVRSAPNSLGIAVGHAFRAASGRARAVGTAGNLTTDTHLAVLAMERGYILYSTDADFARFPGLRWVNLAKRTGRKREAHCVDGSRNPNPEARGVWSAGNIFAP